VNTLGARLALWYSLLSTLTLFGLLAAGYYLLNRHLVRGLDALNAAEFERLSLTLPAAAEGAAGFFVEVEKPGGEILLRSANLGGTRLPKGRGAFTARAEELGELRLGAFEHNGFAITVASPLAPVRSVMEGYAQISFALVCLVLLASLIIGLILSQVALRPLRLIQDTANRIRSDNLSARIPISDVEDEVNSLARLLNEMFDRLETAFQQVRRFSAEASHELKTPLALMRLQGEKLLSDGGLAPVQEEAVGLQLEEIGHMNQIIEELLFLSRAEAQAIRPEWQTLDPREFLESFLADARLLAEDKKVVLENDITEAGTAAFDPKWMRQVLLNLLTNALKATPPGGKVSLASEFTHEAWRVSVEDDGPGLPEADREHIFERFLKLDSSTPGAGLGLAICRSILHMHGGRIRAEEGPRKGGLRVVCEIPLRRGLEDSLP
jgi:signal transduction histidine kinase